MAKQPVCQVVVDNPDRSFDALLNDGTKVKVAFCALSEDYPIRVKENNINLGAYSVDGISLLSYPPIEEVLPDPPVSYSVEVLSLIHI